MKMDVDRNTITIAGRTVPVRACQFRNIKLNVTAIGPEGLIEGGAVELINRPLAVRAVLITVESGWSMSIEWGDVDECCYPERDWDTPANEEPYEAQVSIYSKDMVKVLNEKGENGFFPHMPEEAIVQLIDELSTVPTTAELTIQHDGTTILEDGSREEMHSLNVLEEDEEVHVE